LNKTFRGLYFKQASGARAIAFIGAIARDGRGGESALIQVALPDGAFCASYPAAGARVDMAGPAVEIGPNRLDASGLVVDLAGGGRSARGALRFGPLARPRGDIMGPFRFLPGMECRHHLYSKAHEVSGSLQVDGHAWDFDGALGYIEGDSGRSFPGRYLWTQCLRREGEPRSVMLSAAEIPFCGARFTGTVGFVLLNDREIRLATYLGARVREIRGGRVTVQQGEYTLIAEFDRTQAVSLRAPVAGGMARAIGESLSGRARYRMTRGGRVLFDFTAGDASFEYEYDR